ncbi:hypothetical protein GSI_14617 [Ganoderma sinense ZZ0214-1]|uniref:DUF7918 domain-containing protein n=1 Tax=Ganoderma sinense ZZ0214-1 TaxID=1077348 RepID=A0A2G8RP75_9APHY|nr:hypothetical protein GSI_14617 [Ganoderma sinense ZZ0214-1]
MLHFGYEVWIADSQKERLPEYDVKLEGEDGKTIAFRVCWKDHNGLAANHASMMVYLDGHIAGKTHSHPGSSGKRLGIRTASADTYQPYQFSDLQTTDDDGAQYAADKLGSIELHVVHVYPYMKTTAFRPAHFAGTAPVHERSKKAGAHCVALGKTMRMPKGSHTRVKTTRLDKTGGPAAKFVFRYRPEAILQAQGVMPSSASKGGKSPKTRSATRRKHGQTATSADKRDQKPIKPETGEPRRSGRGDVSGDVIDLSSDDDVLTVKREPRPQRVLQHDPGDVIDLTLD